MVDLGQQVVAALEAEHDLTRRMLTVLEGFCAARARAGDLGELREDGATVLRFFGDFVGALHHEKEAVVVYPLIAMCGDGAEASVVGQLTADHDESDTLLRSLALDVTAEGARGGADGAMVRVAQTYCDRLRRHMVDEERSLFPRIAALPGDDLIRMREEFARLEFGRVDAATWGAHADRLESRYLPQG